MTIDDIIKRFKTLDLSKYPRDEILELLKQTGKIGYILVTFHKGKSLMRSRPNKFGEKFEQKSDYSYKPQKLNLTYQRASTPNNTMFYATSIPEKIEQGELDNARVIGVFETVPMLRELNSSGYQKISFGRWVVKREINLIAIIHEETYYNENSYTRELVNAYHDFMKNAPPEIIDKSLKFQSYLASEFSKEDIKKDCDYMISALFTQMVVDMGFDGVIYPSVRVGGKGFNVAITPEATKNLDLYVAGECSVYKLKEHTVVGNDSIIELDGKTEKFNLIELPDDRSECLKQLGVSTIDELI